jgi:hypothetical protein
MGGGMAGMSSSGGVAGDGDRDDSESNGCKKSIEVEPLAIPISGPIGENPWQLIYGALRNDPEFIAWAEAFWVGKKRNKDNDEILSVEECMQVM